MPSPSQPIVYRHRATGALETEVVYGQSALDWAYGTASGRIFLAAVGKRRWLSAAYGAYLKSRFSRGKVAPFIREFGIDPGEMLERPESFRSFNDFFVRRLRPGARPLAPGDEVAILPADGRHLAYPDVEAADGFVIKGRKFSLGQFLGDAALAERYRGGAMLISRLCPVDYHRFHFPCAGTPGPARTINGPLFSVSPIALRLRLDYLAENLRTVTLLESPQFGPVAYCAIGATMVGGIGQSYVPGRPVAKGEEKGWFEFGGSCLLLLWERGRIRFDADLAAASATHRETYARMGESLGRAAG